MQAHVPTMFLMTIVVALTMSIVVAVGAPREPRDGSFLWALGLGLYAASYMLFALRGQIHDFISIVVGNGFFAGMYALFAEALYKFQQRPPPRWLIWAPVAVTVAAFPFMLGEFAARIALNGVVSIAQVSLLLWALWRGRPTTTGRGQYFLAFGFVALISFYLARVTLTLGGQLQSATMTSSSEIQTLTYLVAIVLLPTFAVGYLVMTRERIEEINRQLATRDQLTGLANRRSMVDRLDHEWARTRRSGAPLSVVMFDVDFFKSFNDRYGHQAGDECLQVVAQCVDSGARRASDLSARYGGEEFLLILPDTIESSAQQIAEDIRQALEVRALPHEGSPLGRVSVSAGVAVSTASDCTSSQALLRAADTALYRAKETGRDRVHLSEPSALPDQPAYCMP